MKKIRKYQKIIKLQETALVRLERNGRHNSITARSLRTHLASCKQGMDLLLQSDPVFLALQEQVS